MCDGLGCLTVSDPTQPLSPMVYVSPGFESLTGYSREELLGRSFGCVHHGEAEDAEMRRLREAMEGGPGRKFARSSRGSGGSKVTRHSGGTEKASGGSAARMPRNSSTGTFTGGGFGSGGARKSNVGVAGDGMVRVELLCKRKSGEAMWMATIAVPVRDAAGRPLRVVAVSYDITARKKEKERDRGMPRTGSDLADWKATQQDRDDEEEEEGITLCGAERRLRATHRSLSEVGPGKLCPPQSQRQKHGASLYTWKHPFLSISLHVNQRTSNPRFLGFLV